MRDAFAELGSILHRILAGERDLKREALARVFRLNTQIGKLAATNRSQKAELRGLQLAVNALTVAIKRGDDNLLLESFEGAKIQIDDLRLT